jgi:hypothetical protein
MRLLLLVSLMLIACSGNSGNSGGGSSFTAGLDYEYAGHWTGPVTMTDVNSGLSFPCTSDFIFSQPTGFFNIDQGDIDCGGQMSNLGPSQLVVINNDLYVDGNKVGQFDETKLSFTYTESGSTFTFTIAPTGLNSMTLNAGATDATNNLAINGTLTRQ